MRNLCRQDSELSGNRFLKNDANIIDLFKPNLIDFLIT